MVSSSCWIDAASSGYETNPFKARSSGRCWKSGQSVLAGSFFCGNRRVGDDRRFLCFAKLAKAFRFAGGWSASAFMICFATLSVNDALSCADSLPGLKKASLVAAMSFSLT
jgi:hypothetical protein